MPAKEEKKPEVRQVEAKKPNLYHRYHSLKNQRRPQSR